VLRDIGGPVQLAEGEVLLREALEGFKTLPDIDPTTIGGPMICLAGVLRAQGRLGEARDLAVDALQVRVTVLGTENIRTATAQHEMSVVQRLMGENEAARDRSTAAFATRLRVRRPLNRDMSCA
jgi:hypothetical protein